MRFSVDANDPDGNPAAVLTLPGLSGAATGGHTARADNRTHRQYRRCQCVPNGDEPHILWVMMMTPASLCIHRDAKAARRGSARAIVMVLFATVLLVAAGGYGVIAFVRASAPLQGESVHDFGTVPITGRETSFTHTFQLTNNSDKAMYIDGVRPSCGCAGATFSPNIVQPGDVLSIEATLTLSKSGYRDANVEILTPGEFTKKVYVKATGRREMPIWSPREELLIGDTRAVLDMPIAAETYGRSEPPPALNVDVPEQFRVALITDWRLTKSEKSSSGEGAQWALSVRLDYNGMPIEDDASATVSMTYDGKQISIEVPIRKRDV